MTIPRSLQTQIDEINATEPNLRNRRSRIRELLTNATKPVLTTHRFESNKGLPHDDGKSRSWHIQREFGEPEHNRKSLQKQIDDGHEQQVSRESTLANARFATPRDKAEYSLHVEGFTLREIADSFGVHNRLIERIITRYNRQWYLDQSKRLTLDIDTLRIWNLWCRGRRATCPLIEVVIADIRRLPVEAIPDLVTACDPSFVSRLGDLTPEGVGTAAKNDPELAALLKELDLE
jgi:hypothetical protein